MQSQRKRNKIHPNEKKKTFLYSQRTEFYIQKNSKESTKHSKILEMINVFSKVTGYRINKQNTSVFLYTTSEQSKRKFKNNHIYNSIKMNKIRGNQFNERYARHNHCKPQYIAERI